MVKSRIWLLFICIGLAGLVRGQVKPNDFPEETSPNNENFEVYSQKDNQIKRASLFNLKKYFAPYINDVGFVPTATGNTTNLTEMVEDPNGNIWYIDGTGAAIQVFGAQVIHSDATLDGDGTSGDPLSVVGTLTDDQNLVNGGKNGSIVTINIEDGTGINIDVSDNDSSPSNEIQTVSKTDSLVTISDGGGSFVDEVNDLDADPQNEIQLLNLVDHLLGIAEGNSVDLSNYLQTLSIDGDSLSISNGNKVGLDQLSSDDQTLSWNLGQRELTIEDGNSITIPDEVDDADADPLNEIQQLVRIGNTINLGKDGGSFTDEVDDADADPNNEFQSLSISGTVLSIVPNGNSINLPTGEGGTGDNWGTDSVVSDSTLLGNGTGADSLRLNLNVLKDNSATNELQTISKDGSTVTLSDGGGSFTDEVNDADSNSSNELQTISKVGTTVTLSDGGGSFTDEVNDADSDPNNELGSVTMSATPPGSPKVGDVWNDTDNNMTTMWNGSVWVRISQFSTGATQDLSDGGKVGVDQTIDISDGGASVTFSVADFDNSTINELQELSTNGTPGNITLSDDTTLNLNVNDSDSDPNNETETAANVGGYTGIYKEKVANEFKFKTLRSSDASVTITESANDIDLKATGDGGGDNWGSQVIQHAPGSQSSGDGTIGDPLDVQVSLVESQDFHDVTTLDPVTTNAITVGNFESSNIKDNGTWVGVGTDTPSAMLDVFGGNINLQPNRKITSSGAATSYWVPYNAATGDMEFSSGFSGSDVLFKTSYAGGINAYNIDVLTLKAEGKVGIFTTVPHTALSVNGTITPYTSLTDDLGSATYKWNNLYIDDIDVSSDVQVDNNLNVDGTIDSLEIVNQRILGEPADLGKTSYFFDGVSYITIPDSPHNSFDTEFSLRIKFKANDQTSASQRFIVGKYNTVGNNREWALYLNTLGQLFMNFGNPVDGTPFGAINFGLINADSWNDIFIVYKSGNIKVYNNGILIYNNSSGPTSIYNGTSNLALGAENTLTTAGSYFTGHISQSSLYNHAISQNKIQASHNGGSTLFGEIGANQNELIQNGDMSSSTGWVLGNASISGGQLTYTPGGASAFANNTLSSIGLFKKTYKIKYTVVSNTLVGTGSLRLGAYSGSSIASSSSSIALPQSVGTHSVEFTSEGNIRTIADIWLPSSYTSGSLVIDDVKITQIGIVSNLIENTISNNIWYDKSGNDLDGTVSGALLVNPTFLAQDESKLYLPEQAITDHQSALTITENQIPDLNHYTDSDIDGTESAFDGWDKDSSDDSDDQNLDELSGYTTTSSLDIGGLTIQGLADGSSDTDIVTTSSSGVINKISKGELTREYLILQIAHPDNVMTVGYGEESWVVPSDLDGWEVKTVTYGCIEAGTTDIKMELRKLNVSDALTTNVRPVEMTFTRVSASSVTATHTISSGDIYRTYVSDPSSNGIDHEGCAVTIEIQN